MKSNLESKISEKCKHIDAKQIELARLRRIMSVQKVDRGVQANVEED